MEELPVEGRLYVKMFGYFEVEYSGKAVFLGRKNNNKSIKFLQILLAYRKVGVLRSDLMQYLFGSEDIADLSNSLRVSQYRMKKMLANAGIPFENYYVIRNGSYYWNEEIPVVTDAELFDKYIIEANNTVDDQKKIELLYQAYLLYHGDYLEEVGIEEWAVIMSMNYKLRFERQMHSLLQMLRDQRAFNKMLEISSRLSHLYPYDEWQAYELYSLKEMGRKQEALDLYQEIKKMYRDELGIDVPKHIMECMYDLKLVSKVKDDITRDICDKLSSSLKQTGAACLNFQNFVDTFRLMMRVSERNGSKLAIMLCELNESVYYDENKERVDSMMERLKETIQSTLRRGDCFTQYNPMKYLILLAGASDDKCELVFGRIERAFNKNHISWESNIQYRVIPIDSLYKII